MMKPFQSPWKFSEAGLWTWRSHLRHSEPLGHDHEFVASAVMLRVLSLGRRDAKQPLGVRNRGSRLLRFPTGGTGERSRHESSTARAPGSASRSVVLTSGD